MAEPKTTHSWWNWRVMRGRCRCCIVPLVLPRSRVESLLPNGIVLVPPSAELGVPGDHHLVFLQCNLQERVVDLLGVNHRYYELIVSIPFVTCTDRIAQWRFGGLGPLTFMRILYLDNWIALLGGRIFWHFAKIPGKFQVEPGPEDWEPDRIHYQLFKPDTGSSLVNARFQSQGEPFKSSESPRFQRLRRVFDQTIVSRSPIGALFTSKYEWDLRDVTIYPVSSDLLTTSELVSGWKTAHLRIESLADKDLGGFRTLFHWALTPARPFELLSRLISGAFWVVYSVLRQIYLWIRRILGGGFW